MDASNGAADGRVVFRGLPRPVQSIVVLGGSASQLDHTAAPTSNAMMSAARIICWSALSRQFLTRSAPALTAAAHNSVFDNLCQRSINRRRPRRYGKAILTGRQVVGAGAVGADGRADIKPSRTIEA
jgi:hypothetical protein